MLIQQKDIFNQQINNTTEELDFESLTKLSLKYQFINENQYKTILDNYQASIINFISIDDDLDEDIELLTKQQIKYIFFSINNYILNYETPYDAMYDIINKNPNKFITEAIKYTKEYKNKISMKISELCKNSKLLYDNSKLYKETIILLNKMLDGKTYHILYSPVSYKSIRSLKNLKNIEKIVDSFLIEASIINKFDIKDVNRIIKVLSNDEIQLWKTIFWSIIYNYLFNYFYFESTDLHVSINTIKSVATELRNKTYDINDFIEIIETGKIKFTDIEKKYLYTYIIPELKNCIEDRIGVDLLVLN